MRQKTQWECCLLESSPWAASGTCGSSQALELTTLAAAAQRARGDGVALGVAGRVKPRGEVVDLPGRGGQERRGR